MHFSRADRERLAINDKILIRSRGVGLTLSDHPEIRLKSLSPELLGALDAKTAGDRFEVPVVAKVPAHLVGAGAGLTSEGGSIHLQTTDRAEVAAYGLDALRLGDLVALEDYDSRYQHGYLQGAVGIAVVGQTDGPRAGYGPGMTLLMTDASGRIEPVIGPDVNLVALLGAGAMTAHASTIAMVKVPVDALWRFANAAFVAMGLAPEDARITADALVYSELRFHPGQGQGVRRLRGYRERISESKIDLAAAFEIVKQSPALALVDGHNGLGSVIGARAMDMAIEKAQVCGIGTVIVRHGTHYARPPYMRRGQNARAASASPTPTPGLRWRPGAERRRLSAPTPGRSPRLAVPAFRWCWTSRLPLRARA